jgi:hypothetical protein
MDIQWKTLSFLGPRRKYLILTSIGLGMVCFFFRLYVWIYSGKLLVFCALGDKYLISPCPSGLGVTISN